MERELVSGHKDAHGRLVRDLILALKDKILNINNYTSFNSIRSFTPAEVEVLVKHIDKCHDLLWQLSEMNDYELPYKCPKLIYAARDLRQSVT